MGTYTYIEEVDVRLVKKERLKDFLKMKSAPRYVKDKVDRVEYMQWVSDAREQWLDSEGGIYPDSDTNDSFRNLLNERKILYHLFTSFGYFIRDFAQFFEGEMVLSADDLFVKMIFENGRVYFKNAKRLWGRKIEGDVFMDDLPPLPARERLLRGA